MPAPGRAALPTVSLRTRCRRPRRTCWSNRRWNSPPLWRSRICQLTMGRRAGHTSLTSMANGFGFTPGELRRLRLLSTPAKIQSFVDEIPYHLADTAWSPRRVLRERTAHCFEGAVFAAAALRVNGYRPLVWDLEADNDTDHVIAIYRERGHWGAVAKSNYAGCRGRQPIYRNLRELAVSDFEGYFSMRRHFTLRRFSRPVNLALFDERSWRIT